MQRLSDLYGRVLDVMLAVACVLLLVMTLLIGVDVLLRNVGAGGIPPSNELSEYGLYLTTHPRRAGTAAARTAHSR